MGIREWQARSLDRLCHFMPFVMTYKMQMLTIGGSQTTCLGIRGNFVGLDLVVNVPDRWTEKMHGIWWKATTV